ncbi:hypothetical protein BS47DRAFT_1365763 [Hydnum rufescens UP504]|uniref:Uncharacterized protein n=1 Tax=Hydnum rufescens UP504 TaxID=1448309 RepID=A0A9P6AMU7_9AGAM|nr:hypothetical protein BS47DRAFT_1365763 [Hydnum rufescens UP504]
MHCCCNGIKRLEITCVKPLLESNFTDELSKVKTLKMRFQVATKVWWASQEALEHGYKDQSACATKLLEQISAKKTASQCSQAKEPKTFSIPVEDFKGILDLAWQNKCNMEAGNWIAAQLAILTEDIHNCFDKLEQDVSALSSVLASSQPTSYSQALTLDKSSTATGCPKVAPPATSTCVHNPN